METRTDRRAGGGRHRAGAARGGAARPRARRRRLRARPAPLRPLARVAPGDAERGRQRGRGRDPGARARAQGGHDHARGRAGDVGTPEPDPPRGDRRARDRPDRPAHPRRRPHRRRAHAPSRSSAWRSGTRTAPASGARARATTRSRTAPSGSSGGSAVRSPSSRSAMPSGRRRKVFGGPKYTVTPTYEGMLKEEMDAAAGRHPDVRVRAAADRRDLRAPHRLEPASRSSSPPSTATATSSPISCCRSSARSPARSRCSSPSTTTTCPARVMAEAAHGTAPALKGKNVANPMAMILAGAALLGYRRRRVAAGGPRDPRGLPRGRRRRDPHGRSRRARHDDRVHRRGDPARPHEARGLGRTLGDVPQDVVNG